MRARRWRSGQQALALVAIAVLVGCGVDRADRSGAPELSLDQMITCAAFHDAEMLRLTQRGGDDAAFNASKALSSDWGLAAAATGFEASLTPGDVAVRISVETEELYVASGVEPEFYAAIRARCAVFEAAP